jgi:hypothetical protein
MGVEGAYRKLHVCSRPQLIVRVMAEHFVLAGAPESSLAPRAHLTDEDLTWRDS